ncbi:MAG: hypothetical protein ABIG92_00685 [Candidatus Omnitrophota bacterium]
MRKILVVSMLAVFSLGIIGISYGEDIAATEEAVPKCEMCKMRMKKDGEKGGMHEMKSMMMKGMMQKEMVPTKDGGVIVLSGNKLLQYDKDLNLKKEVEIKTDMECMMKKMKKCMEDKEKTKEEPQ